MPRARHPRDPQTYTGRTVPELLEAMRAASRYPEESLQAWMHAYAVRASRWDGKALADHTDPEAFYAAMVRRGQIVELPDLQ